jgi:hypothetical protein
MEHSVPKSKEVLRQMVGPSEGHRNQLKGADYLNIKIKWIINLLS